MPFPRVLVRKVKVIALMEFELAYYDVTLQLVSHYVMGTSSKVILYYFIGFVMVTGTENWIREPDLNVQFAC